MKNIREKYPLLFNNKEKEINKRFEAAWQNAKLISKLLKTKYKAKTVIVFGSLTQKSRFHKRSDIDIAVESILNERFYEAYGEIIGKFSSIKVDLIDLKDCNESLLSAIKKEGMTIE